jgi:8-oxo-dGTP diphosphatase
VIVEVAAAVIVRPDGAYLLARRPAGKVYAGWWEFPGGKVEAGEPPEQALCRELHEELGIDVRTAWPWLTRVFTYPHATVRLNFFRVTRWDGEAHPKEGQALAWQVPGTPLLEPMLPANSPVIASLALPAEYAISAAQQLGETEFLKRLDARLRQGLKLVQVREKQLSRDALREFARKVCIASHSHGAKVLLNADAVLAREVGADGVHYASRELARLSEHPAGLLAGGSCHDTAELEQAMKLGLDLVVLGPVKATASHPGAAGLGWERFGQIARGASLPVYAIGGMANGDMEDAWSAGAHGVAMIRAAWPEDS